MRPCLCNCYTRLFFNLVLFFHTTLLFLSGKFPRAYHGSGESRSFSTSFRTSSRGLASSQGPSLCCFVRDPEIPETEHCRLRLSAMCSWISGTPHALRRVCAVCCKTSGLGS